MTASPRTNEAIFHAARAIPDADRRREYVREACEGDTARIALLEAMLRVADAPDSLLDGSAGREATLERPVGARPGDVIGRYKLLEEIGEGGFGIVFLAEQSAPVRRKVALKVLKAGMDTRHVVARFEAERQALALMDHPNIAKVFDGGVTPAGRPYFVMELVKGTPITDFCDQNQLTPRQRLELFISVCQAIQHAHQKGIIHRDLKPSNVLVSRHDTTPIVKVIDFGVAKALGQELTDKTLFTGVAQMVGTPMYMSPEQAGMSDLDVDTRSDIYSLGVLLYELLTGATPFDRERFRGAGFDEIRRIIREEEPPKPSTRLSTLGQAATTVSANRGTELRRLSTVVRGELDWIVMKALEKDRDRRYETANGLAMDVQRYLADERVLACPPSARYRLRKFARRNKGGLAVAALVLLFLVVVGSGIGWAVRDRAARQTRTGAQADLILAEVEQLEKEQKWPEALAAARRAEAVVAGGEADAATTRRVHDRLKGLEFINRLEQIRMDRASVNWEQADREYARAFRDYGVDVEELPAEASIERLRARPGLAIPIAAALDHWVSVRDRRSGPWTRVVAVARGIDPEPLRDRLRSTWAQRITPEAAADLRRLADSIDIRAHHAVTIYSLANVLRGANHPDAAVRILREARSAYPGDFWLNYELGNALYFEEDPEGAIRFATAAVSIRPDSAGAHNNLGLALLARHKVDEATACFRRAVELDPKRVSHHFNLGFALREHQNKVDEAVGCFRKGLEVDPQSARCHLGLGSVLALQGRPDEALAAYEEALRLQPRDAYAHHAFGCFLRDIRRDYERASTCLRKAIELDPEYARSAHIDAELCQALGLHGKPDEAMAVIEAVRRSPTSDRDSLARCLDGLAWGLVTHREPARGIPGRAVSLAREAVALNPAEGLYHITLGAALYRAGEWKAAVETLERAEQLTAGKRLGYHAFFIAMSHWHLGNKVEARRWHDRAVEWTDKNGRGKEELRRFRTEAAELLRLSEK